MAQRRGGSPAAPAKQKLRKNHGPKRHMFKDYKPMVKAFADTGILTKYYDFESFQLSCQSRGVRTGIEDMWEEFRCLTLLEKKEYFKTLKEHAAAIAKDKKH